MIKVQKINKQAEKVNGKPKPTCVCIHVRLHTDNIVCILYLQMRNGFVHLNSRHIFQFHNRTNEL